MLIASGRFVANGFKSQLKKLQMTHYPKTQLSIYDLANQKLQKQCLTQ